MNALDYAVVAVYLVAITAFGSYFARFQKNTKNYFLTDNSTPWWAICFTIVATETSTLTFIGVPASAYAGNWTFLQLAAGYVLGRIIVSVLFLPRYFRGALVTSYQLLQQRFGPSVSTIAAGLFLVTRSLADGIRLFATALVISIVTGVPVPWTVVVLGTRDDRLHRARRLGGGDLDRRRADVRLRGRRAGGVLRAARSRSRAGGGRSFGWERRPASLLCSTSRSNPQRSTRFWAGLAGGIALTLATHGTDQFLVQRLLSADSPKGAARGLVLSGFIVFAQFTLFLLDRRDALRVSPALPADRGPAAQRRDPAALHRRSPAARPGRVHHRGDCRGRALAVDQRHGGDDGQRLLPEIREDASGRGDNCCGCPSASRSCGASCSSASRSAAQWLDQSVLDAGLSVLSLTTGPVLGAFLVGVSTRRVGAAAMMAGMAVGASYSARCGGTRRWVDVVRADRIERHRCRRACVASFVLPSETPAAV